MKKLSFWAKAHPRKAITLIVVLKISLVVLAVYTGNQFYKTGISLSPWLIAFATLLLATGVAFYPAKGIKQYALRKACDYTIALASFIAITCMASNGFSNFSPFTETNASIPGKRIAPTAQEILNSLQYRDKESLSRKEKRVLKKEFFKEMKVYAEAKAFGDKKTANEALAIIVSILAAVGLLYLVGALACSLSCSGSDAAAIIVAILGLAGVIIGLIFVIRAIHRGAKKREKKE